MKAILHTKDGKEFEVEFKSKTASVLIRQNFKLENSVRVFRRLGSGVFDINFFEVEAEYINPPGV